MLKEDCLTRTESLPHDVVECIMERLAVKPLLRFKAVSKRWKSTIESRLFQERQLLIHRQQSRDPDHVLIRTNDGDDLDSLTILRLGSSSLLKIPTPWDNNTYYTATQSSCDGLFCFYDFQNPVFMINPTTRWYRPLPLSKLQLLMVYGNFPRLFNLGFGKDKLTGTYKLVWLYNSFELVFGETTTTCEVFDFGTNAWRFVEPSAPYRVLAGSDPVFVDGSLHWFTECKETKVLSFDLHTETFQVISKAPFANASPSTPPHMIMIGMFNLDNRLCMSVKMGTNQVIWSFNLGNKAWYQMCSIDIAVLSRNSMQCPEFIPLTLLDGEKKKLLVHHCRLYGKLAIHDLETKSYDVAFSAKFFIVYAGCYFQSLISIL